MHLRAAVVFACCAAAAVVRAESRGTDDPCTYPDTTTVLWRAIAAPGYGYGFDTLRKDLGKWSLSPFVRIDSIGESVQHRGLFMLTIQDTTTSLTPRKRVWIHARTHPNEVQGTWVTNEIIALLLSGSPLARTLRSSCVFYVLPMYNPDGVELMKPRQNANGVDIESNWAVVPGEPEVQVLRRTFGGMMSQPNPILVALNMHSASGEARYFVYHAETGTSPAFAGLEQRFINGVRSYFPGGIQPWTYFVSWVNGPATSYPESWFWANHREAVMALTYEDMYSPAARSFDSTAHAILHGVGDYIGVTSPTFVFQTLAAARTAADLHCYPNPFNTATELRFEAAESGPASLVVYDLLGREVSRVVDRSLTPGSYTARLDLGGRASGVYLVRFQQGRDARTLRILLTR